MLYFSFWLAITVLSSPINRFPGASAVNNTDEAEAEQQPRLNNTETDAPAVGDVTEPEATEGEATEGDATEVEATEVEATEVEASEGGATESDTSEAAPTAPATPAHNVTRTQALKDWGSQLLATKYMGSLAILYLALCLFLALKNGPIFVR